jgi:hypothetical protein
MRVGLAGPGYAFDNSVIAQDINAIKDFSAFVHSNDSSGILNQKRRHKATLQYYKKSQPSAKQTASQFLLRGLTATTDPF